MIALAACSTERLAREGTLANGDTFKEYSRIPYGYERQIFSPSGELKARQELHTERNFKRIEPGMTKPQVEDVIGAGFALREGFGGGGWVDTYRYNDGVYKLLHVIYTPEGRVLRYDTEWDPRWYSKKGGGRSM